MFSMGPKMCVHLSVVRIGKNGNCFCRRACVRSPKDTMKNHNTYVYFLVRSHNYNSTYYNFISVFNPLKPELNPICYLLALLAHQFLHVSRIRVKSLTFRRLMSYIYIYGAPILDVSRSHTTTQHSR